MRKKQEAFRLRYLATGGAGFIGSNTVEELVRRAHSAVVLDDLSSGKEDNLAEIRSKIRFIEGSITDIEVAQCHVRSGVRSPSRRPHIRPALR